MNLRHTPPAATALTILGSVLYAAAPALAQNLVVNGSFEDPDYPAGVNFGALTGWSINPDVNFEVWDGGPAPRISTAPS